MTSTEPDLIYLPLHTVYDTSEISHIKSGLPAVITREYIITPATTAETENDVFALHTVVLQIHRLA